MRPPLNVDFVDLTSDGEHESLIPVLDLDESSALMLELVKDLIDLTEPVNESDMQTVDLTEETASVVETSMQSLSRSSPVTVDSAEASLSLNVNVIVDLTEDPSVSVDLLDLMEPIEDQADERIEDEEEEVTDSITINGQESDVELEHLHEQLHLLQRKISDLESAEVDFDDEDDSSFIIIDQYKQEACRIYEKISRITGKSQEFVDEPIQFDGTEFTEFNKKLEQMLNENRSFPNALDVLESLERCNRDHRYQLTEEDRSKVGRYFFQLHGLQSGWW